MKTLSKAVETDVLGKAIAKELTGKVTSLALGVDEMYEPGLQEQPGRVRLYEYNAGGGDVYPSQVHIFKVNEVRTNDYLPLLRKNDYLPGEWQNICTPRANAGNAEIEWDCRLKQAPCDGPFY